MGVQFRAVGQAYMGLVGGGWCPPGVPKATLTSFGKAVGALSLIVEPRGVGAVWGC